MKACWVLLCCCGCATQIFLLTFHYMRYDISTTVSFTLEEEITLPAITICANIVELGKWEDQRLRSKCYLRFGKDSCLNITSADQFAPFLIQIGQEKRCDAVYELFEMSSISEILNMTTHITNLIAGHTRYNMVNLVKRDLILHLNETLEIFAKCFTLFWKKSLAVVSTHKLNRNPASIGVFMTLFWSPMASNNQLHDPDVDFVILPVTGLSTSSYNLFMSKLPGPPFATNGLDYNFDFWILVGTVCSDSNHLGSKDREWHVQPKKKQANNHKKNG